MERLFQYRVYIYQVRLTSVFNGTYGFHIYHLSAAHSPFIEDRNVAYKRII